MACYRSRNGEEMATWTLAEEEALKRMYMAGKTYAEMALELRGRSASAIAGKMSNMRGVWGMPVRSGGRKKRSSTPVLKKGRRTNVLNE